MRRALKTLLKPVRAFSRYWQVQGFCVGWGERWPFDPEEIIVCLSPSTHLHIIELQRLDDDGD